MPLPDPKPLVPPPHGITVRMYRQGHGDCFLLAACKADGNPFYMVIDCGLWTGSECDPGIGMEQVVADIATSTGGKVDVLAITHEHMDHVSGFVARKDTAAGGFYWDAMAIDEVWLAWTEDGRDPDANALRERFDDVLVGLAALTSEPARFGLGEDADSVALIRDVLALHTGEADPAALAGLAPDRRVLGADGGGPLAAIAGLSNKVAMKRMRDKARRVCFLSPGGEVSALPGLPEGSVAYALGPPRDPKMLLSLDPKGTEEFKFRLDGSAAILLGTLSSAGADARAGRPFSPRYGVPPERLAGRDRAFFDDHYGATDDGTHPEAWRRIDGDWVDAAEGLALRLNDEVNNTSLVLALELPRTGKVLLFTGDAQRGSWISWGKLEWQTKRGRVTARDLLARTVLYKVGHHGSHNATLNGRPGDGFANLSWLGHGAYADEFTALIPANRTWAEGKRPKPWKHPLKAIEEALLEKAGGRVLRMDQRELPAKPADVGDAAWKRFADAVEVNDLYMQYTIHD